MQVDFVHLGYHKTATTWLQLVGLPSNPDVALFNQAKTHLDAFFSENFVQAGEAGFDSTSFKERFIKEVTSIHGDFEGKITGISEENLSGHYWTGDGEQYLPSRVKEVFGETKIILTIRNQLDMLISLYANYIKAGSGTSSFLSLLDDKEMGSKVFEKLCYDKFMEQCIELFGRENILVVCYEDFSKDQEKVLNEIFRFVGAGEVNIPARSGTRKVNSSFSKPSEFLLRHLNRLNMRSRVVDKLLGYFDWYVLRSKFKRSNNDIVKFLPDSRLEQWRQSNKVLSEEFSVKLADSSYLL